MKTAFFVLAAGALFAAHMSVRAQGSLYDSRQGIVKGTSPGIVIIPARNPQASAAAAASAASSASAAGAATQATGPKAAASAAAAGSAPTAQNGSAPFTWGAPPSGQPLSEARKLDSPTLGIPIPVSGGTASRPAGNSPPKPGG
jgi:pilus assembly protein FimV